MGFFSDIKFGDIFGAGQVADLLKTGIDRAFPDKTAEAKAQLAADMQTLGIAEDLAKGQMAINQVEAASSSVFVAGWRPALGWVCAVSLAAYYPPRFIIATGLWAYSVFKAGHWIPPQDVGISDILGLVGSMLGLASLRTVETIKGVARQAIGR